MAGRMRQRSRRGPVRVVGLRADHTHSARGPRPSVWRRLRGREGADRERGPGRLQPAERAVPQPHRSASQQRLWLGLQLHRGNPERPSEHMLCWMLETYFENGAERKMEHHLVYVNPTGWNTRAIQMDFDRATNRSGL